MFLKTIDNEFAQGLIRAFGSSQAAVTPLPFHIIGTTPLSFLKVLFFLEFQIVDHFTNIDSGAKANFHAVNHCLMEFVLRFGSFAGDTYLECTKIAEPYNLPFG